MEMSENGKIREDGHAILIQRSQNTIKGLLPPSRRVCYGLRVIHMFDRISIAEEKMANSIIFLRLAFETPHEDDVSMSTL